MTTLTNIEASMLRYLYEQLTVPYGITIFEDLYSTDFSSLGEWVVIDSLSNSLGPVPRQNYFLHIAQQKGAPNAKAKLLVLVDRVSALLEMGQEIDLYDLQSGLVTGTMTVVQSSVSPVLQHKGGGGMRTLNVAVAYPG